MIISPPLASVPEVGEIDVTTPFEELTELRSLLTVNEIAEMTGLRRETLSRARPDSRFQRRTEKGLHDLYVVAGRLRPMVGDDAHLAAVLRRPQAVFGERSIAALLKEGRADLVLEHLTPPEPTETEQLENLRLPAEVEARLTLWEQPSPEEIARESRAEERVAALLAADPELAARLGAIEAALRAHFGPEARVERRIIEPCGLPDGRDQLYLRIHTDASVDEEIDRLGEFLRLEEELLAPVMSRLTIGFLG